MADKIAVRDELLQRLKSLNEETYKEYVEYFADNNLIDTQIQDLQYFIDEEIKQRSAQQQQQEQQQQHLPQQNTNRKDLAQTKQTMSDEAYYTPKARAGMRDLQRIVIDNKRDLRRVRKALDRNYCNTMIDTHNAGVKHEKSKWHGHFDDVNGDNIPDYIIHGGGAIPSNPNALQCNGEPIIVNGWTTKKSDYPVRRYYYDTVPEDQRKENPLSEWKRNKNVWGIEYTTMDDTDNPDLVGNVKAWNENSGFNDEEHKNWKLEGWNVKRYTADKPPKRANPYYRFCNLFMKPFILRAAEDLIAVNAIPTVKVVYDPQTGQQSVSWPDKAVVIASVNADLYADYILRQVCQDYETMSGKKLGINLNCSIEQLKQILATPDGKKFKNSKQFKATLDQEVSHWGANLIKTYRNVRLPNGRMGSWGPQDRAKLQHAVIGNIIVRICKFYNISDPRVLETAEQVENQRLQQGDVPRIQPEAQQAVEQAEGQ